MFLPSMNLSLGAVLMLGSGVRWRGVMFWRRLAVPLSSVCSAPQIPVPAFSLVTKEGQPVHYDMEVPDSGIELQCTLAPDCSVSWAWRVKHGQLENRP